MGAYSNYYQKGDWHDTLLFDSTPGATVRFFTDTFTGEIMIHCHYLVHQDTGMMAVANIGGVEGATYNNAKELDSTCYWNANGRGFVTLDGKSVSAPEPTPLPSNPPQLPIVAPTQSPSTLQRSSGAQFGKSKDSGFSYIHSSHYYSYCFSFSFSSSFSNEFTPVLVSYD